MGDNWALFLDGIVRVIFKLTSNDKSLVIARNQVTNQSLA